MLLHPPALVALTDRITDHFFVTEQSGLDHLKAEGRPDESVHFTGNTMIDTLLAFDAQVQAAPVLEELGLKGGGHVLMTIHRPATVDSGVELAKLVELIDFVAKDRKVVFPVHPRTTAKLQQQRRVSRALRCIDRERGHDAGADREAAHS